MITDRSKRLAELQAKHKELLANPVPVKCLRVKGQISLAEYPFINDRYKKIQREIEVEEQKRFWANSKPVDIPEMDYPSSQTWRPTSRFALISQFLP